jgi:hypothetical protein
MSLIQPRGDRELIERIKRGELRVVTLDPAMNWHEDWLGIIVAHPTGVVYENQCDGNTCDHRYEEGFYVPLEMRGRPFSDLFHGGRPYCRWWSEGDVPEDLIQSLEAELAKLYYLTNHDKPHGRGVITLDRERLEQLVEGWIPVRTPDGPGILAFGNCD